MLAWALRSTVLVGFVAVAAAQYLVHASGSGDGPASRVALAVRGQTGDPETTGSIGRPVAAAARGTRLDPCGPGRGEHLRP